MVHRKGFGRVRVVGFSESADLFSQFGHAREDAAPEGTPLQLAEPGFHGIEPGRAGRREVQVKAGMGGQEVPNRFGRVRTAVVDDQVQHQVGRCRAVDLREGLTELRGAMATGDPAEHLPGRDMEGRIQIRGPMPLVVVGAALDLAGLQRKQGMSPVEGLDLRLLVDREHECVVGWVQVEADEVDDLLGEARVPTELEGLELMGLDVGGLPDLPYLPLCDPGVARHQPCAPMGCLHRDALGGQQQDALDGPPVEDARSPRPRAIHQAAEPLGAVASVPEVHGRPADVQESGGVRGAAVPVQREQDARSPRLTARGGRPSQPPFQGVSVIRAQLEALGPLHASDGTRIR